MNRPLRHLAALACALFLVGLACSSTTPRRNVVVGETAAASVSASASAPRATPSASESAAPSKRGAVKAPVYSDDGCESDGDCAPVRTCHPDRCVAKDKVGTLPAGTMCTEICMGQTLDCAFNRCACAKKASGEKRCAVVAP